MDVSLWWTGHLSKLYPASQLMTVGGRLHLPWDPVRISRCARWMLEFFSFIECNFQWKYHLHATTMWSVFINDKFHYFCIFCKENHCVIHTPSSNNVGFVFLRCFLMQFTQFTSFGIICNLQYIKVYVGAKEKRIKGSNKERNISKPLFCRFGDLFLIVKK